MDSTSAALPALTASLWWLSMAVFGIGFGMWLTSLHRASDDDQAIVGGGMMFMALVVLLVAG